MAAKWIDFSREWYMGRINAGDTEPYTFPTKMYSETFDDVTPLGAAYIQATGKQKTLAANVGKIVRAVDFSFTIRTSTDVVALGPSPEFGPSVPAVAQSYPEIMMVQFLMPALGIFATGFPPFVTNFQNVKSGYEGTQGRPGATPGWVWEKPQRLGNFGSPARPYWEHRGSFNFLLADRTYPLTLITQPTLSTDFWPGGIALLYPASQKSSGGPIPNIRASAEYTRCLMLLDDKPTWTGTIPTQVGVGNVSPLPVRLELKYANGETVSGQPLQISTTGGRVLFATTANPNQWSPSVRGVSDATGVFEVRVRGVSAGDANVTVEIPDNRARGVLYSPNLFGSATIKVFGAGSGGTDPPPVTNPPEVPPPTNPPEEPEPDPSTDPATHCTTYPGIPDEPGRPGRIERSNNIGWNSGANSIEELNGSVRVAFDIGLVVGVVLGFTPNRGSSADHTRITHGFLFSQDGSGQPQYRIMESGVARSSNAPYTPNTTQFEIRRVQGAVQYLVDGVRVYASRVALNGQVLVGTTMYATGDTV